MEDKTTPLPWYDIPHPEYAGSDHRISAKPDAAWGGFGHIGSISANNAPFLFKAVNSAPVAERLYEAAREALGYVETSRWDTDRAGTVEAELRTAIAEYEKAKEVTQPDSEEFNGAEVFLRN